MLSIVRTKNEQPKDTSTGMLTMFSQIFLHEFTNYSQTFEFRANLAAPHAQTPPGPAAIWIVMIPGPAWMYGLERP